MSELQTTIAKNLLFYRKKNGLSQKDLASLIGVKHNTVSAWESCTNSVDIDSLFKICNILNVPFRVMIGDESENYNNFILTNFEKNLIQAYRDHHEIHTAINKLLDIT